MQELDKSCFPYPSHVNERMYDINEALTSVLDERNYVAKFKYKRSKVESGHKDKVTMQG